MTRMAGPEAASEKKSQVTLEATSSAGTRSRRSPLRFTAVGQYAPAGPTAFGGIATGDQAPPGLRRTPTTGVGPSGIRAAFTVPSAEMVTAETFVRGGTPTTGEGDPLCDAPCAGDAPIASARARSADRLVVLSFGAGSGGTALTDHLMTNVLDTRRSDT